MFDQMVKLKMNRIIFYHFPNEPLQKLCYVHLPSFPP